MIVLCAKVASVRCLVGSEAMNQKDANEWYPMEPISKKMSKKMRIALLEQRVKEFEYRIRKLEVDQRVVPSVPPSPVPWQGPWLTSIAIS